MVQLSAYEKMLNDLMIQQEVKSPVVYDEENILVDTLKVEKQYKLIKSKSIKACLHLIRFNALPKPVSEPVPSEAY